jgi:serine protease inhibitor ecotin
MSIIWSYGGKTKNSGHLIRCHIRGYGFTYSVPDSVARDPVSLKLALEGMHEDARKLERCVVG